MSRPAWGSDTQQPLALGSFRNWLKLVGQNGVDRRYWRRALFVTFTSFATIPFRAYEHWRYDALVKQASLSEPPIFIIGHWRSGTTPLHYLMCQDKSLGYVPTFQIVAPGLFLTGQKTIKPLFARLVPTTRMQDDVPLTFDSPQEEEFALANLSPHAMYHHLSFPRHARYYFDRYVLFRDTPERVVAEWKALYLDVLRKATLYMGGRRLLLKNPPNTGRIRVLLELFPDAKFIHIYRNPYRLFLSMRHFYESTLPVTRLQDISPAEIDVLILAFYRELMQKYLAEKDLIPSGNLVEVRFEDWETDPLDEMRRIYDVLGLPGFAAAEADFGAYIASQAGYQKNPYVLAPEMIEKVKAHWQFALDHWGYTSPDSR